MSLLVFMFFFLAKQERHLKCAGCAALLQIKANVVPSQVVRPRGLVVEVLAVCKE